MSDGLTSKETRVLNPRPRRHHRPAYSMTEVRLGLAVLVLLASIGAWIAWRGAHPDPSLFAEVALDAPPAPVDRGALPPNLAHAGWREGTISRFDAKNLYEKINGRADFFLSRGFRSLTFMGLAGGSATVDIELYDMGSAENALGVFSGEKAPETRATSGDGTHWYRVRNALFVARGPYYMRVLGSDEGPGVVAQLDHVRGALEAHLPAGDRPWSHALFADALGVAPDRITYERENAFSFGFAKDVHVALLADGETEAFVTTAADPAAAVALAKQFEEGFLSYGEREPGPGGTWVKDRYLGSYTRVMATGSMVVGVRGATKVATGAAALDRLGKGVAALPAAVVAKAGRADLGVGEKPPSYE